MRRQTHAITRPGRLGAIIVALVYLIVAFQVGRAAWALFSGAPFPPDVFIAAFVLIAMLAVCHGRKGPLHT